jgi:hypothetical protein
MNLVLFYRLRQTGNEYFLERPYVLRILSSGMSVPVHFVSDALQIKIPRDEDNLHPLESAKARNPR